MSGSSVWEERKTNDGAVFYFNKVTRRTSYEMPDELKTGGSQKPGIARTISRKKSLLPSQIGKKVSVRPMMSSSQPSQPSSNAPSAAVSTATSPQSKPTSFWKKTKTPEGKSYYYNTNTRETRWTRPEELEGDSDDDDEEEEEEESEEDEEEEEDDDDGGYKEYEEVLREKEGLVKEKGDVEKRIEVMQGQVEEMENKRNLENEERTNELERIRSERSAEMEGVKNASEQLERARSELQSTASAAAEWEGTLAQETRKNEELRKEEPLVEEEIKSLEAEIKACGERVGEDMEWGRVREGVGDMQEKLRQEATEKRRMNDWLHRLTAEKKKLDKLRGECEEFEKLEKEDLNEYEEKVGRIRERVQAAQRESSSVAMKLEQSMSAPLPEEKEAKDAEDALIKAKQELEKLASTPPPPKMGVQSKQSTPQQQQNVFTPPPPPPDPFDIYPYFHGSVSGAVAERLLQGKPNGTFLFRHSSHPNHLACSYLYGGTVQNALVAYGSNTPPQVWKPDEDIVYNDLPSMIADSAHILVYPLEHNYR